MMSLLQKGNQKLHSLRLSFALLLYMHLDSQTRRLRSIAKGLVLVSAASFACWQGFTAKSRVAGSEDFDTQVTQKCRNGTCTPTIPICEHWY